MKVSGEDMLQDLEAHLLSSREDGALAQCLMS
jgi:hypothetical protein